MKARASGTQLLAHLRTPLYRNGYMLIINAGVSSVLGLLYWVIAARYYTTNAVGLNSAAISAMMLLAGIAQLNLHDGLMRFVPIAGAATAKLIGLAYGVCLSFALVVGVLFCLGLNSWAGAQPFLGTSLWLLTWFITATMAWCIFALQDAVMTGLRQTVWIPIENTLFSVVKIVLLVVFAASSPRYGIFASWTIPVALSLLPVNVLIFRRLISMHTAALSNTSPLVLRRIVKFIAGNYLSSLFLLLSTTLLPVLVTQQAGPKANAYFYLPWMITSSLQLVATNMTASYTVEATLDQAHVYRYGYEVLLHIAKLLVPCIAVVLVGAPYMLRVFGEPYAVQGTALLRLLALATVPNIIIVLSLSLARIQQRIARVVSIQGVLCIFTLALSYSLLRAYGIKGIGFAWLISQTAVAIFLLITQLRPIFGKAHRQAGTTTTPIRSTK